MNRQDTKGRQALQAGKLDCPGNSYTRSHESDAGLIPTAKSYKLPASASQFDRANSKGELGAGGMPGVGRGQQIKSEEGYRS